MKHYDAVGTAGYRFELTGGHAVVNFANTVGNRSTRAPVELLPRYASLVSWARQARQVSPREAARLRTEAVRRPRDSEASRLRALALRDALFGILESLAARRRAPAEALAAFNAFLTQALARRRVREEGRGLAWEWGDEGSLDSLLWPLVQSAAELLTSAESRSIRKCAADDCGWLFLDTSRNGRRRWCDMAVCGNRAKNRRYYGNRKQERGGTRRPPSRPARSGSARRP